MPIFGSSKKEYRDGEKVSCAQCGKQAEVKWFPSKKLVVVSPKEREQLALRCQSCGFITCDDCAHPDDSMFPICPGCKKEWGPYYFIGGPAARASEGDKDNEDTEDENEDDDNSQATNTGNWDQAMRMELPQMDELRADVGYDNLGPKRFSGLRRSPFMLLIFLLIGVIVAGAIFALLRVPNITSILKDLLPGTTPTPLTITSSNKAMATVALNNNQSVVIEGYIQSPSEDNCKMGDDGFKWCQVFMRLDDASIMHVFVRLGSPANSVTGNFQFMADDGELIPNGSLVKIDGTVHCQTSITCRIEVERIQLINKSTRTPESESRNDKTPTSRSRITRTATPVQRTTPTVTITPTAESSCMDALDVTLDDLGKELCVQGVVIDKYKEEKATLIYFSKETDSFIFVSYGPPLEIANPTACVMGTGKIAQLGARPVIVVSYNNLLEVCP